MFKVIIFIFLVTLGCQGLVLETEKTTTKESITTKESESKEKIKTIEKRLEKRKSLLKKKNRILNKILALAQASLVEKKHYVESLEDTYQINLSTSTIKNLKK